MIGQFPEEQSKGGEFRRQEDTFRDWVSTDKYAPHPAIAGRYHLYVSLACPWASRTVIIRQVKGLEGVIGMTVVDPVRDERGWAFRVPTSVSNDRTKDESAVIAPSTDPVNGFHFLSEAYLTSDSKFAGRTTVPVLWDNELRRIVNNSEDDICRMFNEHFNAFAAHPEVDLFPPELASDQADLSKFIYENVNNGVYRAGFATRQRPYEISCNKVFNALDELERRLTISRYLFNSRIVETDWRLFCTLIRFDAVYHGHFKCNLRRIVDYPALNGYLLDLYQQPGISETVNFDHIKRHYYITHNQINPTRIVPIGPKLDLSREHGREQLS